MEIQSITLKVCDIPASEGGLLESVKAEDFDEIFRKIIDCKHILVSKTKDAQKTDEYLKEAEELNFLFQNFVGIVNFNRKR